MVAALVVSACDGGTSGPPRARAARPNVLFVLTDDLDATEVAVMPHLLIRRGVSFTNDFVSVSLCCPSRSTTLRGQYSHNTGVETNGGSNGGFETAHRLGIERSTIGTWLQRAGYRTALIGKYLNGYPNTAGATYVPPGWDEFASAAAGNPYSQYDYTLNENGRLVRYGHAPGDYGTDVYVGKAESFVRDAAAEGKPFFAYLAVYAPHQPATPAPADIGRFAGAEAPRTPAYDAADLTGKPAFVRDRPLMTPAVERRVDALYRRRIRSLQAVDRGIASLVKTLRETHQLDDTYIVFTSDNGFHLGQFRMPAGKQTAYDFDIHVPLVVRGPEIPAGRTSSALVGNVDLAPTFAAMAGVRVPSFVDGRSWLPWARDPAGTHPWRRSYLVEHWREVDTPVDRGPAPLEPGDVDETVVRTGRESNRIPDYHGIRTTRYLYVEYVTGERELYDLRRDPYELHNLVEREPQVADALARRLAGLRSCAADACRTEETRTVPG